MLGKSATTQTCTLFSTSIWNWYLIVNYAITILLKLSFAGLCKDLRGEIKKAADFLRRALTKEDFDQLEKHLHISSFEKNEAVNFEGLKKLGIANEGERFIRKGNGVQSKLYFLFKNDIFIIFN